MLTGAAVAASSNAASSLASQIIMRMMMGSFNPNYKKEDRRKMRYIQRKYSLAYQSGTSGDDPTSVISSIDPNSKLLMAPDGLKPSNPFQDEPQFEESLQMNFHPVSGHQGRFVASHAMACIGVINDYQIQRRARPWVPGISSPGRPNDYINMFLEESKTWMRAQMTLDAVHSDELARRDNFYTKLKNDNYFWCFPHEKESRSIHKVIDFIHDKVKNALELISREEKNKSLQSFFKELNDHSTNAFEFGKQFLAYLLYPTKKIGGNILANTVFDGRTYETGKLHNLLESATNIVLESYVADMNLTHERTNNSNNGNNDFKAIDNSNRYSGNNNSAGGAAASTSQALVVSPNGGAGNAAYNANSNGSGNTMMDAIADAKRGAGPGLDDAGGGQYMIDITEFEESTLRTVTYIVEICDPKGLRWIIRKTFPEFEALNVVIFTENRSRAELLDTLQFPAKLAGKLFRDKEEYYTMCRALQLYFTNLLCALNNFNPASQNAVCAFMEVKQLILSSNNRTLRRAEAVPNVFIAVRKDFTELLIAKDDKTGSSKQTQALAEFRRIWGIEMAVKVFDAYALLQRMATVLGWTLEINHFFISMFGNTLAFSKLPLRDIIFLQKDIMSKFLAICSELFDFACKVNADSKYKWHKNLQMVENQLTRVKFHIEKSLALIGLIDTEHLDYEVQMRRLRDVHARFQPLMNRIDGSLGSIQEELSLPITHHSPQFLASAAGANTAGAGAGAGSNGGQNRGSFSQSGGPRSAEKGPLMIGGGRPSLDADGKDAVSANLQLTYTVEEPDEVVNTAATATTRQLSSPPYTGSSGGGLSGGNSGNIFSRDQSPDMIPTNSMNPLSGSNHGNSSTHGASPERYPYKDTAAPGIAARDGTVEEEDGEYQQQGPRSENESTVCVIC